MTLKKRVLKLLFFVLNFLVILFVFSKDIYAAITFEEENTKMPTTIEIEAKKESGEYFIDSQPAMEYTEEDLNLFATLIYAEAGICDDMEEYRVGNVVLNRVKDTTGSFENSIQGVIFQSGQFTSVGGDNWNNGPTEREIEIAKDLLDGKRIFPEYVVWFSRKQQYGELYYTSDWHDFSGWSQNEEETE